MVEGRQEVNQLEHWLVRDDQLEEAIHLFDGSHLPIIWTEGLIQNFRGMDAFGLHNGYLEEQLNIDFIVKFYERHDTSHVMASWWREDNKYTNRSTGWYQTTNLMEPYIYLMALICQLYGDKDCSRFLEAWIPLAYAVAISRRGFN